MSILLKQGKCSCGCVNHAVRLTSNDIRFTQVSGMGYVVKGQGGEFGLRVYDEYFEDTETFAGELPTTYAVKRAWQSYNMSDEKIPQKIFENSISNLKEIFFNGV
jgi:hypothetical protein